VKAFGVVRVGLVVAGAWLLFFGAAARADVWRIESPDHAQTFAYGSERHRAWAEEGRHNHLVLFLSFTNDPYVSSIEPRQYDDFTFSFPNITLGKDGRTFYYHAHGRSIAVAEKRSGFLGIEEIRLLPSAALVIDKPHGYLSLSLVFTDDAGALSQE
jgi:hypothetical protein